MSKLGRPTKYKKEFCSQAEKLCKKGFIDTEIADFFGVAESTIHKWKLDHKDFSESLKLGKKHSDDDVVDALYKRAIGYEAIEVKEEDGTSGVKTTVTTRQIAGDSTAQIWWLSNRQPDKWKRNPEPSGDEEVGKPVGITFNISPAIGDVKVTKGES